MTRLMPEAHIILEYKHLHKRDAPTNRIDLLKGLCKKSVLYELAALNYYLRPNNAFSLDTSLKMQLDRLRYFSKTEEHFKCRYSSFFYTNFQSENNYPTLFHRMSCMFAIEEVILSDEIEDIKDFEFSGHSQWDAIVDYLLSVNSFIINLGGNIEETDENILEALNPVVLPLNELCIETDSALVAYRGYQLLKYLSRHKIIGKQLDNYIKREYDLSIEHFVLSIMWIYMAESHTNRDCNFLFKSSGKDYFMLVLEKLSSRTHIELSEKLLCVRTSPLYKISQNKYLILDNTSLLEKLYSQFINDFWFSHMKLIKSNNGTPLYTFRDYRGIIGYFFEDYVGKLLKNSFSNYKYSKLLIFDELKINLKGGELEIADAYLRYGKKIILSQVKSGNIYDKEKYGGTTLSLYKKDRIKFFETFGVDQIVESISRMIKYIKRIDNQFQENKLNTIYPCIIVNDRALQTPLMADIFNRRFQEILAEKSFEKLNIKRLSLIHVSDLEQIESHLHSDPKQIWNLFAQHFRDKRYIPPFYLAISKSLKQRNSKAKHKELMKELRENINDSKTCK